MRANRRSCSRNGAPDDSIRAVSATSVDHVSAKIVSSNSSFDRK